MASTQTPTPQGSSNAGLDAWLWGTGTFSASEAGMKVEILYGSISTARPPGYAPSSAPLTAHAHGDGGLTHET